MNVGSVTIALFTLVGLSPTLHLSFLRSEFVSLAFQVIAWHTFIAVWWSKRMTSLVTPCVCSIALWLYSFLYATIFISSQKNPLHRYYLPTPVRFQSLPHAL